MQITLEQRYKILSHLNFSLMRSYELNANYQDFGGDLWHVSAQLNPTEYQANRPQTLLFQEEDIWKRFDNIEAKSSYLVCQILNILEELDYLESELKQVRNNANYALTEADVLKWDINKKTEGIETQRDESIERLRMLLGLPPTANFGNGATRLNYG